MSTIVHAREGGGLRNVHVDKIFGKMQFFAASDYKSVRHALVLRVIKGLLTKIVSTLVYQTVNEAHQVKVIKF